ncbi:MAG: sodium/proline symporter [Bacteroidales bacterium]|nr:sodium/proline symporter [Bacteroidales bacterium]
MDADTQILLVMAGYLALLIAWGLYQGKKVKTDIDYSMAGRNLPGWVAGLSERAAGESSWALLGLPGAAYATGLMEIWTAAGCVAGIITAWALLAWRLRDEAEKYDIATFSDYIAKRHSETGRWIRIAGSMTIVFFFFFYIGAQFLGGGKTLFTLFGIKPDLGMLIIAVVVVPYTIYGGFRSVAYTDVLQALIMIITLVAGPLAGMIYLAQHAGQGFFAGTITGAVTGAGDVYKSLTGAAKGFGAGVVILGGFSWFFGYLGGQPQLSLRFMAIKDKRQARLARNIGIIWTLLAYLGALSLGWIGIAMFGPEGLEDQEYVMPKVIATVFPPAIAGILITGAIAAIVSTANSLLIVSSTELSENIIKPFRKRERRKTSGLAYSRLITGFLALIALVFAYLSYAPLMLTDKSIQYLEKSSGIPVEVIRQLETINDEEFLKKEDFNAKISDLIGESHFNLYGGQIFESAKKEGTLIFTMVSYVWAGIGGTFSIVILLTLFWRRYHGRAALLTILSGLLFTIIWIGTGMEEVVTSRILTFLVAGVVAVLSTLLIPSHRPQPEGPG